MNHYISKLFQWVKQYKKPLALVGIIGFLLITRLIYLDALPTSLTHDESTYAIEARSIALQGTDLTQTWNPWSLKAIHKQYAEFPALFMAPFVWIFSHPMIAAKIPFVIMGVLMPFIMAWFVYGLWRKQNIAWAMLFVASASPWLWQFSRLSFDVMFSLFFYFLGAAWILNTKKWISGLALVWFAFGFFEYQGLKLVFLPWVGLWVALKIWREYKSISLKSKHLPKIKVLLRSKDATVAGLVFLISILIFLWYLFVSLPSQSAYGRVNRTILTDQETIAELVNTERRLSLDSPLLRFASNRATVSVKFMLQRLSSALDPNMLFISSEANASGWSVWSHGVFYLVDFVLIILGFGYLIFRLRHKLATWLFLLMIPLAPAPALITTVNEWYLIRASLMYLLFLILISLGLTFVWHLGRWWKIGLVVIYSISVGMFIYEYFFRFPIYSADEAFYADRVISKYISLYDRNQAIVVHSVEPEFIYYSYLFYNNELNENTKDMIPDILNDYHVAHDNVTFTDDCIDLTDTSAVHIASVHAPLCEAEEISDELPANVVEQNSDEETKKTDKIKKLRPIEEALSISAVLDSGVKYNIYNDSVCKNYDLRTYIHVTDRNDFSIEKMSTQEFCEKWITDLRPLK